MKRLTLLATAAAIALVVATGAASAPRSKPLCVGKQPGCYGTIQAALAAAPDGATIQIHHGTYAGGITITSDVTLMGAGKVVISGGGPVVTIGSTTSTPTVRLTNLTITGGVTTTNPQAPNCGPDNSCGPGYADATALGGGIEAFPGTNVTLLHTVVTGNVASPAQQTASVKAVCPTGPCPASFGDGAGIDDWGAMTLDHSTVSDNHSSAVQTNGGGITVEAEASLALRNSTVSGNTASAAAPTGRFSSGGGIWVDSDATLTVQNSSVSGNGTSTSHSFPDGYPMQDGPDNSNSNGGGIFVNGGGTATISNSHVDRDTITVNVPDSQSAGFDAGLCAFGQATLDNSTVSRNSVTVNVLSTADSGPSGSAVEFDDVGSVRNSTISDNTTTVTASTGDAGATGAVAFFEGPGVTVTNTRITGNTMTATSPDGAATVWGGGIFNNGPLVLVNDQVSDNSAAADGLSGLAQGGGIANGIFSDPGTSPLTLQNTHVTHNKLTGSPGVTLQGGGLYTVGFPVTLTNTHIDHNTPDNCEGC